MSENTAAGATAVTERIVVDQAYTDIVCRYLRSLASELRAGGLQLLDDPIVAADDDRLGLALVQVTGTPGASGPGTTPRDAARRTLTATLRRAFVDDYGWVPALDFDHRLDHVGGLRHSTGPNRLTLPGEVDPAGFIQGGGTGFPTTAQPRRRTPATGHAGDRVRVGVLDTELFPTETLFGSCLADPAALLPEDAASYPYLSGHATFVAGLIQHKAPDASIEVHTVLRGADARASTWQVACTIAALADAGLDILNLSLGCFTEDNTTPLPLARAVELLTPQTIVVAAAGNYGAITRTDGTQPPPRPFWPAAMDNVLAVGADYEPGTPADFSVTYPWVNAYAPGVDVTSTYLHGKVSFPPIPAHDRDHSIDAWPAPLEDFEGFARWSGTSFAAATASGAIAARTLPGRRSAQHALALLLTDTAYRDPDIRPASDNENNS